MSTEVATQETGGQVKVWKSIPKALRRDKGMQNMDTEDIAIPRLLLAQSGSPAVKKSSEKHITGLTEGDFYNSISKKIYGPSVRIVPVAFSKNRLLYQDDQIECRSDNGVDGGHHSPKCGDCEYAAWGTGKEGKGTACTLFKNYVVYIVEDRKYALLSFKRGSLEMAKQFNATITDQTRGYKDEEGNVGTFELEIYGCEYQLTATPKNKGEYSWFALGYDYVRDVEHEPLLDEFQKQQEFFTVNRQTGAEE